MTTNRRSHPIFADVLESGIEWTSKLTEPGYLFVAFRTEQTARDLKDRMNQAGFTVEICPNPTWIKVLQDY